MENLGYLIPILFISGAGVVVLVAVAIVQDLRQERKYGYRQAFFTVVSLVMIALAVGSTASLVTTGLKASVLKKAQSNNQYRGTPPAFYLENQAPSGTPVTSTLTCATDCQFSAVDKQNFTDWKTNYQSWKDSIANSTQTRRDLAASLSLFIISLPLYLLFARWMNRGSAEEQKEHQRLSPLRSVYFYGVAFGGLILAVVSGAMLINTGLKVALKTETSNTGVIAAPTKFPGALSDTTGADSVVACADKCGFTAADVALAQQWKQDYQSTIKVAPSSTTQNDLANEIPLVAVGIPLFWFHFARIRKETQAQGAPATT